MEKVFPLSVYRTFRCQGLEKLCEAYFIKVYRPGLKTTTKFHEWLRALMCVFLAAWDRQSRKMTSNLFLFMLFSIAFWPREDHVERLTDCLCCMCLIDSLIDDIRCITWHQFSEKQEDFLYRYSKHSVIITMRIKWEDATKVLSPGLGKQCSVNISYH